MPVLEHAEKSSTPRTDLVPATFEEVFQDYYDYVVRLVVYLGIDAQSAEDVAVAVLEKFFERDALSDYDPNYVVVVKGLPRQAAFRTFLNGFVRVYVQHHRKMQHKTQWREAYSLDATAFVRAADGEPVTWAELRADEYTEQYDSLMAWDFARTLRARLAAIPPHSDKDRCNLAAVLDVIVEQLETLGRIDIAALADHFGVGRTTAHNWMARLRSGVLESLDPC